MDESASVKSASLPGTATSATKRKRNPDPKFYAVRLMLLCLVRISDGPDVLVGLAIIQESIIHGPIAWSKSKDLRKLPVGLEDCFMPDVSLANYDI